MIENHHLDRSVDTLECSVRVYNFLKTSNIQTVRDLVQIAPHEMLAVKDVGRQSVREVEYILSEMGLGLRKVTPPPKEAKRRYESDLVADFLKHRCVIGEGHSIRSDKLYDEYANWSTGEHREILNRISFGRRLTEKDFTRQKRGRWHYRKGITLKARDDHKGDAI